MLRARALAIGDLLNAEPTTGDAHSAPHTPSVLSHQLQLHLAPNLVDIRPQLLRLATFPAGNVINAPVSIQQISMLFFNILKAIPSRQTCDSSDPRSCQLTGNYKTVYQCCD
jgi:hypothetical protein